MNRFSLLLSIILGSSLFFTGCNDMMVQPKFHPQDESDFYPDGRSARPLVPDTVSRGNLRIDTHYYEGKINGKWATTLPMPLTKKLLARGQERYNIYCSVCHGRDGYGNGMIVQRGFPKAASYHTDKLRKAPISHFFDVMSNGFGVMYSYSDRISVEDRWAIAAYIRALQRSQHTTLADVPVSERTTLENTAP